MGRWIARAKPRAVSGRQLVSGGVAWGRREVAIGLGRARLVMECRLDSGTWRACSDWSQECSAQLWHSASPFVWRRVTRVASFATPPAVELPTKAVPKRLLKVV